MTIIKRFVGLSDKNRASVIDACPVGYGLMLSAIVIDSSLECNHPPSSDLCKSIRCKPEPVARLH